MYLPLDILDEISNYLPLGDLYRFQQVCPDQHSLFMERAKKQELDIEFCYQCPDELYPILFDLRPKDIVSALFDAGYEWQLGELLRTIPESKDVVEDYLSKHSVDILRVIDDSGLLQFYLRRCCDYDYLHTFDRYLDPDFHFEEDK